MTFRFAAAAALALVLAAPLAAAAAPSADPADVPAGQYVIDKHHSSLIAKVMHMGVSLYAMRFDSLDATFDYDPAHPEAAKIDANVDAGSLDVGQSYSSQFAEEFLQAGKFPKMSFTANSFQRGTGNTGTMSGDLTFMGVTKPETFDVTFIGTGRGLLPPFKPTVGFTAVTRIKRSEFGSTYLNNLVGDDVTITVEAEFDHR